MPPRPELSVVLVSDYGAGGPHALEDLRRTLAALARQDFSGSVEFLLVERADLARALPADLAGLLPDLRVVASPETSSYGLKNHGVAEAQAEVAVILDADCRPREDWLSRAAAACRAHPDAAAISGRTTYDGRTAQEAMLALLSRAHLDRGTAGPIAYVSNNNAAWRRAVYLEHPLPTGLGPFAARLQSEAVRRAGGRLLFDPAIAVTHEFEGWRMEADIRRNAGYGTVITRLHDAAMPYARLVRTGPLSIPLVVAGKVWNSWRDCLRCWRFYGLRAHHVPLALGLAVVVGAMEIPGMWAAFTNRPLSTTAYR